MVIATAVIIMMTWGNYNVKPFGIGYLIRFCFHTAYGFVPALFIHFTLVFPKNIFRKTPAVIFYLVSFLCAAALNAVFVLAVNSNNLHLYGEYILLFNFCRYFVAAAVILSLIVFIRVYTHIKAVGERKKLKWILVGLIIGPGAFIFLWVIPQSITTYGLVPEELIVLLMTSVPVAFGIAIVKYHLLDIDLLLRRSLVYTLVIALLLAVYLTVVIFLSSLANAANSRVVSIIAAVFIALISQPVKLKVQHLVDIKFYRVNYNFNMALKKLFSVIKDSNDIETLADNIKEQLQNIIPVNKADFVFFIPEIENPGLVNKNSFNKKVPLCADLIAPYDYTDGVYCVTNYIEPGIEITPLAKDEFLKEGYVLLFPVLTSEKKLVALFLLGERKAENKFSYEDVDLLKKVADQAGLAIERILLQESIIKEKLEKRKYQELNEIKSLFISGVSHELKTPLTSIKMFAELMSAPNLSSQKKAEYFKTIEGESNRLTNMINNILNISKIEKGVQEYYLSETDLNSIIKQAVKLYDYQFEVNGFEIVIKLCEEKLLINGDENALLEIITNLFSNAVKYSIKNRRIEVCSFANGSDAIVKISDKGIGIAKEELERIFEPFYRAGYNENKNRIEGAGLGLAIVKHIMNAHNGNIIYESEKEKGTTVSLSFPLSTL